MLAPTSLESIMRYLSIASPIDTGFSQSEAAAEGKGVCADHTEALGNARKHASGLIDFYISSIRADSQPAVSLLLPASVNLAVNRYLSSQDSAASDESCCRP